VLDRIEVDVIHMPLQVGSVADLVFPKAALPQTFFSLASFACGPEARREVSRKRALEQAPAAGVVGVAFRQCPDGMEVIGQDANGEGAEGTGLQRLAIGLAKERDFLDQQPGATVGQGQGEEPGAAGHGAAPVVRHGGLLAFMGWCGWY